MNRAIGESNARETLPLSPAALPVLPSETRKLTDGRSDSERLDVRDVADDLEVHVAMVTKRCRIVNARSFRGGLTSAVTGARRFFARPVHCVVRQGD
ncbi:MAG: hypothetical protein N2544_16800 [Burkholderiales bacterium]|nr:hypothetical protein [Burkholderiales bacterium]